MHSRRLSDHALCAPAVGSELLPPSPSSVVIPILPNVLQEDGWTPLHAAAAHGFTAHVDALLLARPAPAMNVCGRQRCGFHAHRHAHRLRSTSMYVG